MPPVKTRARRTGPQAAKAKQQHPTEPSAAESLLFSQFTAMLDLIKPELATAQIDYVELTVGDYFLTRLFAGLTAVGTIRLTLLSLLHEREASVAANLYGADGTQPG